MLYVVNIHFVYVDSVKFLMLVKTSHLLFSVKICTYLAYNVPSSNGSYRQADAPLQTG